MSAGCEHLILLNDSTSGPLRNSFGMRKESPIQSSLKRKLVVTMSHGCMCVELGGGRREEISLGPIRREPLDLQEISKTPHNLGEEKAGELTFI